MDDLDELRKLASALRKQEVDKLHMAFDPNNPDSRPTEQQLKILQDVNKYQYRYVLGGNQCFQGLTEISMWDGTKKYIKDIELGDKVVSINIKTLVPTMSTVTQLHHNGKQKIYKYNMGVESSLISTPNHKVFSFLGGKFLKREISSAKHLSEFVVEYPGKDTIDPDWAELLGFLLGDGCFAGNGHGVQFSNTNEKIIARIKSLIDDEHYWRDSGTGDFYIRHKIINKPKTIYVQKLKELGLWEKLAGTKFIPEIFFKQSLSTRRRMIGGLIATDGWIADAKYKAVGYSTTSKQLALDVKRLLSSVGIFAGIKHRKRSKATHADEYTVSITKKPHYNKFISDVFVHGKSGELVDSTLSFKPYACRNLLSEEYVGRDDVYDITVDHPDHNYIANGYLVSNSGKSQTGGKECAWILTETHPYWKRPKQAGNAPLTLFVVARTSTQFEEELWKKKIRPFLKKGEFKEDYSGGTLKRVIHLKTKNTILFFSHHAPEEAREKVQSFTADWLWLDEMPNSFKLIEELHRRCMARKAPFLATFTPKLRNDQIRRMVDAESPFQLKYKLNMMANPIYENDQERIITSLAELPAAYRKTILEGDWYLGDEAVYAFNRKIHVKDPINYSYGWRHIEVVDPAASGKAGYLLIAEDPVSGVWYVVKNKYLKGESATILLSQISSLSAGYNIIRRVSDPHEAWFIKEAANQKIAYAGVYKKNDRKKELIKNLQEALNFGRLKIASWCQELIDEFVSCQWSETVADKIVGASKFHLLDSAQYGVDNFPKQLTEPIPMSFDQELKAANKKRKENEAKRATTGKFPRAKIWRGRRI